MRLTQPSNHWVPANLSLGVKQQTDHSLSFSSEVENGGPNASAPICLHSMSQGQFCNKYYNIGIYTKSEVFMVMMFRLWSSGICSQVSTNMFQRQKEQGARYVPPKQW
jgi:hypothetical protein